MAHQDGKALFEAAVRRAGFRIDHVVEDSVYQVVGIQGSGSQTVSARNILRDYERDGNPEVFATFVAAISHVGEPLPPWSAARSSVLFSLEPADYDFGDTLRATVTKDTVRVLVVTLHDGLNIRWLTSQSLKEWGVTLGDAEKAAHENMNRMLAGMKLTRYDPKLWIEVK